MSESVFANPFVALMRRYIVDYTSRHDTTVCADIMEPGYTLRMGDFVLKGRDELYIPAAAKQFEQFPGLCITVHEIVTNGDRLALRFSEHGSSMRHGWAQAAWVGVGVYRWNGTKLIENFVEQDYLARQRQLSSGQPAAVASPAVAPWDTQAVADSAAAEAVVADWIAAAMPEGSVRFNDGTINPVLDEVTGSVDDMFSAGDAVAFRATLRGIYTGGLPEIDAASVGKPAALYATGIVHVSDGQIASGHVVSGRHDLVRALTARD